MVYFVNSIFWSCKRFLNALVAEKIKLSSNFVQIAMLRFHFGSSSKISSWIYSGWLLRQPCLVFKRKTQLYLYSFRKCDLEKKVEAITYCTETTNIFRINFPDLYTDKPVLNLNKFSNSQNTVEIPYRSTPFDLNNSETIP
jgi:hypothetical protein